MSKNNGIESTPIKQLSERNVNVEPQAHILTNEKVIEQMRSHNSPIAIELKNLNRLIQGMSTAHCPTSCSREGTSSNFIATEYQSFSYIRCACGNQLTFLQRQATVPFMAQPVK